MPKDEPDEGIWIHLRRFGGSVEYRFQAWYDRQRFVTHIAISIFGGAIGGQVLEFLMPFLQTAIVDLYTRFTNIDYTLGFIVYLIFIFSYSSFLFSLLTFITLWLKHGTMDSQTVGDGGTPRNPVTGRWFWTLNAIVLGLSGFLAGIVINETAALIGLGIGVSVADEFTRRIRAFTESAATVQ